MTTRTVPGFIAYAANETPGIPTILKGATGTVYAASDVARTTPLTVRSKARGSILSAAVSNLHGVVEPFTVDVPDDESGILWVAEGYPIWKRFEESVRALPGRSAYEEAVARGFIGTEQAWLESLHGRDGANVLPTDAAVANVVADPTSALRGLLDGMYGSGEGGGGGGGVPWAGGGISNVMDYGAKANGTDDSAAIQAALNAGNGIVMFPAGKVFSIGKRIRMRANTTIIAYGATIRRLSSCYHMVRNFREKSEDGVDDNFPGYTGNGNLTILGGTWDCNRRVGTAGNSFTFAHCSNVTVKDATFIRNNDHVFDLVGVDGALFENCRFYGFEISGTHKEAIQVDSAIPGAASSEPKDGTPTRNVTVRDCYVGPYIDPKTAETWPSCGRFVGSHSVSSLSVPFDNVRVLNNVIESPQSRGINAYGWSGFEIAGNTVIGSATAGIVVSTPTGVRVTDGVVHGNKVINNVTDNAYRVISEGTAAELRNIELTGNTSRGSSNIAIRVENTTAPVVAGNRVIGAGTSNPDNRAAIEVGTNAIDAYVHDNTVVKAASGTQAAVALRVLSGAVRPRYARNHFLDGLTIDNLNSGSITS